MSNAPEEIEELKKRIATISSIRTKYADKLREQEPLVEWAKRERKRQEAKLWERIREHFPNQKWWAANLAAHGWVISCEDNNLYAVNGKTALVSHADASPVDASDFPACCLSCSHQAYHSPRLRRCSMHSTFVLEDDICESHVPK